MTHEPASDALAEVGRIATALANVCLRAVGALKDLNQDDFILIPGPIEEQVKPAIEEPTEFGSIVRARYPVQPENSERPLWQLSPAHGKHYWISQAGELEVWSELTDVEVLRVGLGDDLYPRPDGDVIVLGPETFKAPNGSVISHKGENYYPTDANAITIGVGSGKAIMAGRIHNRLQKLLAEAITAERKHAYEKAIQAVEELAP